ncbi:DUF4299 family protein [[Mycoplasma] gypis]|uniref:DUF4299 family protein n=1 Tax=[Mycoplasma] gypis TaxID=92404 RepID=A0ABZ2RUF1_9BACT|nr:DUF4299 family protein [[Mycoplasma] gypis]MBN0919505.1 DUF4299 family protein [[Mycoplasma] gypis]
MSLRFTIDLGSKKKEFDIKQLASEDIEFGYYDNEYRLEEGAFGSPTIFYDKNKIGRGIGIVKEKSKLSFINNVPSTKRDIDLMFELIKKTIEITGAKNVHFDDKKIEISFLDGLKEIVEGIHKENLYLLEESITQSDGDNTVYIYGAKHIVSLGIEEAKKCSKDWKEYENYLHEVQSIDVYYAQPFLTSKNNEIVAFYTLGNEIPSSLPFQKDFFIDKENNVSKFKICFFDVEKQEVFGMIAYEEFLKNIDTTKKHDAQRFIIELNIDEMKSLIEKYGENM